MKDYSKTHGKKRSFGKMIGTAVAILVIIALIIGVYWSGRVKYYDDPAVKGNTSMNLLNGGLFSESDGKIYFANPYDQNTLYVMDENFENVEKLSDDNVSYLNVAGEYIFYTRRNDKKGVENNAFLSLSTTGLYRIGINGDGLDQLYREPTQTVNLLGNQVYYQHYDHQKGLQLFNIGIDGKEDIMMLDEGASPTAIVNNTIYYTGVDSNHNIHAMDISSYSSRVLLEGNYTGLSYYGDYLYFIDMERDYVLCRSNLDGSDITQLTTERIATYNVSPDGTTIYYQIDNGTDNGIYALEVASGSSRLLRDGDFNYFHTIGDSLFFEKYDGSAAYVMDISTEEILDFQPGTEE